MNKKRMATLLRGMAYSIENVKGYCETTLLMDLDTTKDLFEMELNNK